MSAVKIHFICLALALFDLLLFSIGRISFRGQWLDILLSFAPMVSAVVVVSKHYRLLPLTGRIYFSTAIIINLLLIPIFLLGTTFYHLDTITNSGSYEARERMGLLSPPAVNLIYKWGPFEKMISPNLYYDIHYNGQYRIRIVYKPDSVGIALPGYGRPDTTLFFKD